MPGASFLKETVGGRWHYWRARVGKKLTRDKPILRRYPSFVLFSAEAFDPKWPIPEHLL
jgi:hypothetical protein